MIVEVASVARTLCRAARFAFAATMQPICLRYYEVIAFGD
jgi:hypothetical protein